MAAVSEAGELPRVEHLLERYLRELAAWERALLEVRPLGVIWRRPAQPLLSAVVFP